MQNLHTDSFFSGISGLQLPIRKDLYPAPFENASRLSYYSSLFNSIEFNSSFYKIPQAATVTKWAALVSDNFKFTFKLWKNITHSKGLHFNEEDVLCFFKSINRVQEKKGCLLIQLPPSSDKNNSVQLNKLLSCIKNMDTAQDWKITVEFRNASWYQQSVYDLLDFYKASIVIHDIPKSATPFLNHRSDFIYIRFHGPTGNYRGSYTEDFLTEYATYINEWLEDGSTVYVYFNNTIGNAFNNLISLNRLVLNNPLWHKNF